MTSRREGKQSDGDGIYPEEVSTGEQTVPLRGGERLPYVPGFSVRRLLGRGGMGAVYEAEQFRPRRVVALKVIRSENQSPALLRRFETEIEALAALEHPNVARIYDAGAHMENGTTRPYYAMEYIDGAMTIEEYANHHNLSVRQRVEMFLKVCDAVYAGHCRGIVHRDLKPENILVDSHGEPKVIDFGVARIVGGDVATAAQTVAGQIVGTVRYMSPEQVEARPEAIDERSDVYALGVILYELLTGEMPYELENRTLPEIAKTIRESPPKHPSAIRRTVTGDLETVVLKAIEKARSGRYQTAQALRSDLWSWLHGEPIEARHSTLTYIAARRFRQLVHRAPVVTMLLAALAVWVVLHMVGGRVIYIWAPSINWSYRSALAATAPTIGPPQRFQHVTVIALDEETMASLPELAEPLGIEGVAANNPPTARGLHGVMMKRLAEADVKVVAWDVVFVSPQSGDALFVEGVKALAERGVPVIIAHPGWGVPEGAPLRISPAIEPHVRSAWAAVYTGKESAVQRALPKILRGREGWAHTALALDRGRPHAIQGFAILCAATYRQPDLLSALRIHWKQAEAELHYFSPAARPGQPENWTGEVERVRFSGPAEPESQPEINLHMTDTTAVYSLPMPSHETLALDTRRYEWALHAPIAELRSVLRGRLVMIGFTDGSDVHDLGLDRVYHGVHIKAAATDAILRRELIRLETIAFSGTMIGVGCVAGLVAGVWLSGPRRRALLLLLLSLTTLIVLSFWLYSIHRYVYNPMLPVAALLLTAAVVHNLQRAQRDFVI